MGQKFFQYIRKEILKNHYRFNMVHLIYSFGMMIIHSSNQDSDCWMLVEFLLGSRNNDNNKTGDINYLSWIP